MRKIKQILAFAHNVLRYVKWNALKRETLTGRVIAFEDLWYKINTGEIQLSDDIVKKIHALPKQRRDEYNVDGSFSHMIVGYDVMGQIEILKEHLKYRLIYLSRSRVYPHKHGIPHA